MPKPAPILAGIIPKSFNYTILIEYNVLGKTLIFHPPGQLGDCRIGFQPVPEALNRFHALFLRQRHQYEFRSRRSQGNGRRCGWE